MSTESSSKITPKSIDKEVVSNVAERLRFFFSDANLRIDKFLRNEIFANPYVSIETLLKFNTIKQHSENPEILVKAVKEDERLKNFLKLNDTESSIARVEPFTRDKMRDNIKLSLRVSDIPTKSVDNNKIYSVTINEVKDIFKEFGSVAMVRMLHFHNKRERKRVAIGRAFVEFESLEEMKTATAELCPPHSEVALEHDSNEDETANKPKRTLKLGENELRIKTMQQWLDKKERQKNGKNGENKGRKRMLEEETEEEKTIKATIEAIKFSLDWKKGCIIALKGLPEGCDREKILQTVKMFFGDIDVSFRADYSRGQKNGAIRFEEFHEKISDLASKLNDNIVLICGEKIESASIMEGEEEEKYYKEFIAFRTKQMRSKEEGRLRKKARREGKR